MKRPEANRLYNPLQAEPYWQEVWAKEKLYEPDLEKAQRPFYNLMMFPYPSAEGLHVGHAFAFSGSDIYGRFKQMQGYEVFEPIGFDAFGIHSENFALKKGQHPRELIQKTTQNYTRQLKSLGNRFAWSRVVDTTKPEYYRWTQWLFLQLFKAGLAERKEAPVNWCDDCKTVLADEQVIHGRCERCDSPVRQKNLKQWFLKIATGRRPSGELYVERLHQNLAWIDWSENVKKLQRAWIGRSEGAVLKFKLRSTNPHAGSKSAAQQSEQEIEVFTTRPDTVFGATFLVLSPEKLEDILTHDKLEIRNDKQVREYLAVVQNKTKEERVQEGLQGEKSGVKLEGVVAVNPATGEEIPVYAADFVIGTYGGGAVMGVPAHDERDFAFAKSHNLPIKMVVKPPVPAGQTTAEPELDKLETAYTGEGVLINSGQFNGLSSQEARLKITQWLNEQGKGYQSVSYKLRDWLISRQRYWGPPIPIIYCRRCREMQISKSKIANSKSQTKQLKGGIDYTILDGKEYAIVPVPEDDLPVELPYVKNFQPTGTDQGPLEQLEDWVKVKCPRCGGEARRETDVSDNFLDSAWYFIGYLIDLNKPGFKLPQKRLRRWLPVDMYIGGAEHAVLHLMYTRFITLALHDLGYLHFEEPFKKFRAHGHITKDGAKMSKSRGNVVNPDEYIANFGADVFRMYLMFLGPFTQGGDFRDQGIQGMERFLKRIWNLIQNAGSPDQNAKSKLKRSQTLEQRLHHTIKRVTEDIEGLKFNTALAALMEFVNELRTTHYELRDLEVLIKLLAPFAPHFTETVWRQVWGKSTSVHQEPWPEYDERLLKIEKVMVVVQVNGKVRDKIEVPIGASRDQVLAAAKSSAKVQKWLKDSKVRKTVYVPNRLVNFVVD